MVRVSIKYYSTRTQVLDTVQASGLLFINYKSQALTVVDKIHLLWDFKTKLLIFRNFYLLRNNYYFFFQFIQLLKGGKKKQKQKQTNKKQSTWLSF